MRTKPPCPRVLSTLTTAALMGTMGLGTGLLHWATLMASIPIAGPNGDICRLPQACLRDSKSKVQEDAEVSTH